MDLAEVRKEMHWSVSATGEEKDILLVVHNGYEYVKNCVESVFSNTKDFKLLIWDNASSGKTAKYLDDLRSLKNVKLHRSETNEGFIVPNNRLFLMSDSKWVILLNSDTEVLPDWDDVMIGFLKNHPKTKQVGYCGATLNSECEFSGRTSGREIDYVVGYCFCMARKDIEEIGLFDELNMDFAYCEDSDLSLRIRERGWEVYACHSKDLVRHYGGKTTSEVISLDERLKISARKNLEHLKRRWGSFLDLYRKEKTC